MTSNKTIDNIAKTEIVDLFTNKPLGTKLTIEQIYAEKSISLENRASYKEQANKMFRSSYLIKNENFTVVFSRNEAKEYSFEIADKTDEIRNYLKKPFF